MDLPNSLLLYVLLLVAVAIGFLLGRRDKGPGRNQTTVIKDYYQGLNFLLGERPELGVDRFIQAMEVNDDSADVHLALASVLRRRGEVEKAIRLHQNLLASPLLNSGNKQLVEMELARDYHAAGLLDRAEGLLRDIVKRQGAQYKQALSLLMDLYEQERDWENALQLSKGLSGADDKMRDRLSHFHCEVAVKRLAEGQHRAAMDSARAAIDMDADNPRGYWLAAEIDYLLANHKSVLRRLNKVVELQRDLCGDVRALFAKACDALGNDEAYLEFLRNNLERYPDPRLLVALIEYRKTHGVDVGLHDIVTYIEQKPGEQHLMVLLDLLDSNDTAAQQRVRKLLSRVASSARPQQCSNCGFASSVHLWHCPTCKQWGSFAHRRQPKAAPASSP